MMKKYFYLAIAAIVSVAFASCGDEPGKKEDKKAVHTITVGEVTATTADITVTPKDAAAPYFWNIFEKEAIEAEFGTSYDSVASYLCEYYEEAYEELLDQYGASMLEQQGITDLASLLELNGLLVTGVDNYSYEGLSPETTYLVVAFSFDATTNRPSSAVATAEFTTLELPRSANRLTIAVNPTTYMATVTATNNDPYFFICEPTADYLKYNPDYTEASVAKSIDDWVASFQAYGITLTQLQGMCYFTGNQNIDIVTMFMTAEDGTPIYGEYIAYAAPYNGGVNGTAVSTIFNYGNAAVAPAAHRLPSKKIAEAPAFFENARKEFVIK